MLINLDQSFDRVDHWFLVTVLETARFKPEFRKWISIMYHNLQAVVQFNRKCSEAFAIEGSVWQGSLSLLWSPCSVGLGMRSQVQPCAVSFLLALFRQRYPCTLMISIFVSCRLDIKAVKVELMRYEQIAEAKINFDKSKGLQVGVRKGDDPLPGPFCWSGGSIPILGVWFRPGLQLE